MDGVLPPSPSCPAGPNVCCAVFTLHLSRTGPQSPLPLHCPLHATRGSYLRTMTTSVLCRPIERQQIKTSINARRLDSLADLGGPHTYFTHESTSIIDSAAIYAHLDNLHRCFPDLTKCGVVERRHGVGTTHHIDYTASVTC